MSNTSWVERKAVVAVKDRLMRIKMLEDHIPEGDKEVLLDGHITVYSDDSGKKAAVIGNISTQVKGTEKIADITQNSIKYDVDVEDLKGFKKMGGVLYFVVAIQENRTKIYFTAFTPVSLTILLSTCSEQTTKRITMFALPENDDILYSNICTAFFDMKRQASFSVENMIPIEELDSEHGIDSINFSLEGVRAGVDLGSELFANSDIYLYARTKDRKISIPVIADPSGFRILEKRTGIVTVQDRVYYDTVQKISSRAGTIFKIGDSLSFQLKDEKKQKIHINFKPSNWLSRQIIDYNFMIDALKNGGFEINGIALPLDIREKEEEVIHSFEQRLEILHKVKDLLTKLNVHKDLDVSKITEKDNKWLAYILKSIVDGEEIVVKNNNLSVHGLFSLGNLNLLLVISPIKGKEFTYRLYDFFDSNLVYAYDKENGEKVPVSMYCVLNGSDFCKVDNINYCNIAEDFRRIYNTITKDIWFGLNKVMLCLLKAYDESKMQEQLQAAEDLSKLEYELLGDRPIISKLNQIQIAKRQRKLNGEEIKILCDIIENKETDIFVRIGAHILLDNETSAWAYINELNAEDKTVFMEYPIWNFMNE